MDRALDLIRIEASGARATLQAAIAVLQSAERNCFCAEAGVVSLLPHIRSQIQDTIQSLGGAPVTQLVIE